MTRTIVGGALTFNAANNRITTAGYTYDASGNLTNDTLHIYTFDAENKISKVDAVSAYVYNGEGQRVKKLVGENTRFVYGIGGQLVAEFDGLTSNLKEEYVQAGATLITIEPTAVNSNGTRYTTSDTLGTPRVVTNSSAGVVSRHDLMPFGEELGVGVGGRTMGMGFGSTDALRQKFTSKERDSETGLDYFGARYYASTQGRFTSPDSIYLELRRLSDPQQLNIYSYTRNSPLNNIDPDGPEKTSDGTSIVRRTTGFARFPADWPLRDFHLTLTPVEPAKLHFGLSLCFAAIMRHFVGFKIGNGQRPRRIIVLPRLRNHDRFVLLFPDSKR